MFSLLVGKNTNKTFFHEIRPLKDKNLWLKAVKLFGNVKLFDLESNKTLELYAYFKFQAFKKFRYPL